MDRILVEVKCPATNKTYDCWIGKNLLTDQVMEELCNQIILYEGNEKVFNEEAGVLLFSVNNQFVVNERLTVIENGIKSGDTLLIL